jgi:hypothetical protein
MKPFTTILFLLLVSGLHAQKWHLERVDKSTPYKYEYWFQFQHAEDSCSYSLKKSEGGSVSTIRVRDNKGDTLLFANVRIKNLRNDSILNLTTNINGAVQMQLQPGRYTVNVFVPNYDRFSTELIILENEAVQLDVRLGLAPELDVYQINSKSKLQEAEIIRIMDCVKTNRQDYYKTCSKKDKFLISMHL